MLKVYDLRTEHESNPLGVDAARPRFGWKLESDKENVVQTSWQLVARDGEDVLWDSGLVENDDSIAVRYAGKPLASRQRVVWQVTVHAGGETASAEAWFEMGLLHPADWQAKWIEPEADFDEFTPQPSPYLRKAFTVRPGLVRARAYQTAHGLYQFWMNGQACSERRFAPGNTSYYHRLQYGVDDITPALSEGENVWAVRLGDGWWRGAYGAYSMRNNYGNKVQFLGQLVLEYADGTQDVIITDEDFKTATGGLLQCDMKLGTVYDARKEPDGWQSPGFEDSGWRTVHLGDGGYGDFSTLIAERGAPIREKERFAAAVFTDADGSTVLDFGQNLAGYVCMRLRGCKPGQRVRLEHGETLREGRFDLSNIYIPENSLYPMFQTVEYIARGEAEETFQPEFSVFGFRYVRLTGFEGDVQPGDFTAVAVYSDMPRTGSFTCSNPLLDKLVQNSLWSQKGNFLDVPTDCPTRERAPWTGDAQVYCRTSTDLMDVYSFFEKWMQDVSCEQAWNGQIPSIAPSISFHHLPNREKLLERIRGNPNLAFLVQVLSEGEVGQPQLADGSAGWGDAATVIPYMLYLCYGDSQILANQYASAKKWVDYMAAEAKKPNPLYKDLPQYHTSTYGVPDAEYIWDTGFHWGEWSEPAFVERTLPENFIEDRLRTGTPVVATAYLSHSARLLGEMAAVLGKTEDAAHYTALADKTADIYDRYFVHEDGTIALSEAERQAPFVRVLAFNLCAPQKRPRVVARLLEAIEKNGYHLNTGFLSTPMLLRVLAEEGHADTAFCILEQTTPPSWLYPVTQGQTTILESWDGVQKHFGSFNHYSYGAVCDFLFGSVCGIQPSWQRPGYKHFLLRPAPGGSLTHASAEFESPYGLICSSWKKDESGTRFEFSVPANTTATITLPDGTSAEVGSGTHCYHCAGQ